MSTLIIVIATIALLVLLNGLYVAAEFATVSSRRTRIIQMAESGNRIAKMLAPFLEDPQAKDNYVAACQVGITLTSLILGAYGQNSVATALAPLLAGFGNLTEAAAISISVTLVLILLTIIQVIIGELFPKSIALLYPEELALATIVPVKWSLIIFKPLIWLFNGSGNFILRLVGVTHSEKQFLPPEEIELLVSKSREGGLLQKQEQQLLRNAFRLRELVARQVMVPRTRLVAAPVESTIDQIIEIAGQAGYSRIPLYRDTIDDIIGFAHIKDLFRLRLRGEQNPHSIVRDIIYVPETLPVAEVWFRLNANRQYIAIVFDEYGGVAGLITFEDVIEEIFGELQDEFDQELPLVSSDKEGRIHLRGDLLITDVNEYLGLELPDEEDDTLGGLVFSQLGRLPVVGDEVTVGESNINIRVEAMDERSILELSLLMPTATIPRITEWESADDY